MAHGKDTKVFVDEYDWTTQFRNSSGIPGSVDMAENSTYGSEDKTYEPGLGDAAPTLEGILTDSVVQIIAAWKDGKATHLFTRALDGGAVGGAADSFEAFLQAMDQPAPVGDIVVSTLNLQAQGGVDEGVMLEDGVTSRVAPGDGTSVDNSASSPDGGVGYLHVLEFTGTDIDITVQDSPNDSTWADVVNFTQVTGVGSERVEAAGTVDQYLQAEWSGTFTSCLFVVVFARY